MGDILTQWAQWWPMWLKERGYCSAQHAKDQAMRHLIQRWQTSPPADGILVVGSTHCPSFLAWIEKIRELPRALVLFPSSSVFVVDDTSAGKSLTAWPCAQELPLAKAQSAPHEIVCTSAYEQAKIIALLVRESIAHHPQEKIALVTLPASLLEQVHFELKRWNINSPRSSPPLLSSLLLKLVKGTLKQWPFDHLVALARHPLVLKAYPIGLAMAAWADRFGELAPEARPLWMRKSRQRVHNATASLEKALKGGVPLPLTQWIHIHITALEQFIPHLLTDVDFIVEKLIQYSHNTPSLMATDYIYWIETILAGLKKSEPCHDNVVICEPDYLPFLSPYRCVVVPPSSSDPFPWLPQPVKNALTPATPSVLEAYLAPEHFIVSCHSEHTDTLSPYQIWDQDSPQVISPSVPSLETPTLPCLSRISISDLHLWLQDFDAFYWRRILKIQPPSLSVHQIWGMAIHTLLDRWIKECPPALCLSYADLNNRLQELAHTILPPLDWVQTHLCIRMLESIALCEFEKRSKEKYTSRTEVWGRLHFSFPEGKITLNARADRIDYLDDGTAHIIDYKTGAVPSFVDIDRMKAVQLPLEALMLEQGGFDHQRFPVSRLSWWHIGLSQGCRIRMYPRALAPVIEAYATQLPLWLHPFVCGTYGPIKKQQY
jgi:RecB family exonuclease